MAQEVKWTFCSVFSLGALGGSEHGTRGWGIQEKAKQMSLLRGRKTNRTFDHPTRLERHKLET